MTTVPLALADIVRLKKPYQPHRTSGLPENMGPFTHGIVAEILHVLPDGKTRNVSLYLYNPETKTIFIGPNGICEYVDFSTHELELYKRAAEMGYIPIPSAGYPLELRDEGAAGYRHYLNDKPVYTGTLLEVLTDEGWILGRYECTLQPGDSPYLITDNETNEAIILDDYHRLRWPG